MARALKSSDYVAMVRALAPEIEQPPSAERLQRREAAAACATSCCSTTAPVPARVTGFQHFLRSAGPAHRNRLADLVGCARPRRRDQHPVHQRHHRLAEGRDADATSTSSTTRATARRRWAERARPALHSGAAVPLLRHGARRAVLHRGRADDGVPGESFDAESDARGDRSASGAPRCTACRPCSSRCSSIRDFASFDMSSCAPASWRARRVRSRPCGA